MTSNHGSLISLCVLFFQLSMVSFISVNKKIEISSKLWLFNYIITCSDQFRLLLPLLSLRPAVETIFFITFRHDSGFASHKTLKLFSFSRIAASCCFTVLFNPPSSMRSESLFITFLPFFSVHLFLVTSFFLSQSTAALQSYSPARTIRSSITVTSSLLSFCISSSAFFAVRWLSVKSSNSENY